MLALAPLFVVAALAGASAFAPAAGKGSVGAR